MALTGWSFDLRGGLERKERYLTSEKFGRKKEGAGKSTDCVAASQKNKRT